MPLVKPVAKTTPAAPVRKALEQPKVTGQEQRAVLYPEYYVQLCVGPERKLAKGVAHRAPLDAAAAKFVLGWESEADYSQRQSKKHNQPIEKCKFPGDLEVVPFEDVNKQLTVCWNNHHNRPFDREHALKLAQDILNGAWRLNMENAIISRYGTVLSAQHRLVALVFAEQMWKSSPHWKQLWKTAPTIECSLAFGCEESPDVLMTLDNVKPRSESDVIYTSTIFADLNHKERQECSRMQAKAVDLLWRRTGAGKGGDFGNKYQTHSTSLGFLDRHKRLVECVRWLFECNKGRQVSLLKLSPGQCAAMMYLMAAGKTDEAGYLGDSEAPSEKTISFELWDDAKEFWRLIGTGDESMKPLTDGLKLLVDPDEGLGGRLIEKVALIAMAWRTWIDNGHQLTEDDLLEGEGETLRPKLQYSSDRKKLLDPQDFGGIDQGQQIAADEEPEPTKEEIEQRKAEERKKQAEKQQQLVAAKKPAAAPKPAGNGQPPTRIDLAAATAKLAGKPAAAPKPAPTGLGQFGKKPAGAAKP